MARVHECHDPKNEGQRREVCHLSHCSCCVASCDECISNLPRTTHQGLDQEFDKGFAIRVRLKVLGEADFGPGSFCTVRRK